ncbi:A/G-specific adenine glycosylase [Ramlibacter sp. 2FC]|uniref:A/G-specific adenine glycosylase n=1 Tax=Ramlibacter sp. 2FC TaxID=2502188 RepID=UPI0010F7CD66|nr:A/G-specific adenine glycosylase [Ramlibacter sp. 2FC]
MRALEEDFAGRVVAWQRRHGRRHLPWQDQRDPYRVWLSEIMLQQTQVATVLDYYPRFLQRFPDVAALAAASLDEVLGLWSGLGYYSRARNLHRCAVEVVTRFGGRFPDSAEQLQSLPGIGRSTAAAIAAFCFGERAAILDGNVKRVLSRTLGYGADLSVAAHERSLWGLAEELLPRARLEEAMPSYTQGLMDLGATVCQARSPDCAACPVTELCEARREGRPEAYPVKTRKLRRSSESLWLLWASDRAGSVWLEQRPTPGVWAGLYCLPLFDSRAALEAALPEGQQAALEDLEGFKHVLTHKDLHLHPVRVRLGSRALAGRPGAWFTAEQWPALGLPAPVRRLLLPD